MSKNAALLAKINDSTFWTGKNAEETTKLQEALDALVEANPEDEQAFQAAIESHESTWGILEEPQDEAERSRFFAMMLTFWALITSLGGWKNDNTERLDEDVDEEEQVVEEDENPSALRVQQAAVAQRVKLGLNKTNDQEVLLKILKYNEAECRAYLAEKVEPSITGAHGWKNTSTPAPLSDGTQPDNVNDSKDVLTPASIHTIKKLAATQWFLQAVVTASLEVLTKLDRAKHEGKFDAFCEAVKELGFTGELNLIDMDMVYDLAKDKIQERRTTLEEERAALEQVKKQEATQWVFDNVEKASLDVLTKLDTAKQEGNVDAFREAVKELGFTGELNFIDMDMVYDVAKDKIQARKTILEDEYAALDKVKKQEATQWVVDNIEKASLELLIKLDTAKQEGKVDSFRAAVKELGFTGDLNLIDMDVVYTEAGTKIQERRATLQAQHELLIAQEAMTAYETYITELSDDEVFAQGNLLLEKDGEAFRSALVAKDNRDKLTIENLAALREKLGERYLKVALARDNYARLHPAIQAKELAEFHTELDKLFPGHTYIAKVVSTPEQMEELKRVMAARALPNLHQAINELIIKSPMDTKAFESEIGQLKALDKKEKLTLEQFRAELAKIVSETDKAALPHLTKENMLELQSTARMRRLGVQLSEYSIYGEKRHPQLRAAFSALSVGKQRDFLERNADRANNPDLRHLLRSTELSVLKKYLPFADDVLAKIQQENINNRLVKSIYNAEVVKCLLNISPPVILSESQVEKINENFTAVAESMDNSKYIALVNRIKVQASISEEQREDFYKVFGLEKNGSVVIDEKVRNNIEEQHKRNLELLKIAAKTIDKQIISPKLIRFLLSLNKGNGGTDHLKMQSEVEIKEKIQTAFRESRSARDFIDLYIRSEQVDDSLTAEQTLYKRELLQALTPELYREIKKEIRTQTFKIEPELVDKELTEVEKKLTEFKRNHKRIGQYAQKIDYIPKMHDLQIYNPEFQSEPEPKKTRYKKILEECTINREQLLHDRRRLQDYLDSIPVPEKATSLAQQELKERIEKLHSGLQAQIDHIDEQVTLFAAAKDKIEQAILPSLNGEHAKKCAYNPETVVTYLIDRAQEQAEAIRARAAMGEPYGQDMELDITTADEVESKKDRVSKFTFENQPDANQVRCFDVTYIATNPTSNAEVKIQGRFIYDKSANADAKGNKSEPGKYIVRQFPTAQEGAKVSEQDLIAAKVNFAMTIATQFLAGMDGPPTLENPIRLRKGSAEELEYVWTALAILGEKVPKMKFGTDAIFVVSNKFDPASQKGFFGYAKTSLYKTFEKDAQVQEFIKDAREYSSAQHDKTGVKNREKSGEKATDFFKKQLHATRVETGERQKDEGLAAEPPEVPVVVPRTGR